MYTYVHMHMYVKVFACMYVCVLCTFLAPMEARRGCPVS